METGGGRGVVYFEIVTTAVHVTIMSIYVKVYFLFIMAVNVCSLSDIEQFCFRATPKGNEAIDQRRLANGN